MSKVINGAKTVNIGGVSLAASLTAGQTFEGIYKGGAITDRLTQPKDVNGEQVQYRLAFIPMEIELDGKKKIVTVVANGRFAEEANKPKNGAQYTVQVEKREYAPANGGDMRTSSSFQMAE